MILYYFNQYFIYMFGDLDRSYWTRAGCGNQVGGHRHGRPQAIRDFGLFPRQVLLLRLHGLDFRRHALAVFRGDPAGRDDFYRLIERQALVLPDKIVERLRPGRERETYF